jgi:hypothetical protein
VPSKNFKKSIADVFVSFYLMANQKMSSVLHFSHSLQISAKSAEKSGRQL